MLKLKIYDELKNEILNCQKCDLCEEGKIGELKAQVVGQGNLNSKVMFVAQNPVEEDVKNSQPLHSSGKSGALFQKVLDYLELAREDVYITNVVSCRSPKNHEPEEYQVLKCKSFLDQQIELVAPKLIVSFGRQAAQHFLNDFKILRDHGNIRHSETYNLNIFPLFHFAYIGCYNLETRKEFKVDLTKLKSIIKELK
jgi:DNA polymerase